MKKNNLLKTVLLFVLTILLLQGCRQELTLNDKVRNEQTNKNFKILKISDIPKVSAFIKKKTGRDDFQIELSKKSIAGKTTVGLSSLDTDIVVETVEGDNTYYVLGVNDNIDDSTIIYNVEVKETNGIIQEAQLIEYDAINVEDLKNLNIFSGIVTSYTLDGNIISSMVYTNGEGDCPTLGDSGGGSSSGGEIGYGGYDGGYSGGYGGSDDTGDYGCGDFIFSSHILEQKSFGSVTTYIAVGEIWIDSCGQTISKYYRTAGRSGKITSECGGDGSGLIIDLESIQRAVTEIEASLSQYNHQLTPDEKLFLYKNYNLASFLLDYPVLDKQSADFRYFAISFFTQNPTTSLEQFQNWFIEGYDLSATDMEDFINDLNNPDRVKPTKKFKNNAKINAIYNQVKTAANFKQYLQNFEPTFSVAHLMFDIGINQNPNAIAETTEPQNYWIKINFNKDKDFSNMPKVLIAYTFMHEIIHAEMYRKLLSVTTTPYGNIDWNQVKNLRNDYPGLFDYYVRFMNGNTSYQHEAMGAHYLKIMVNFLKQVYGSKYSNIEYETIVWMGLQGTTAWNLLPKEKRDLYTNTWNTNYWLWEK